MNKPPTLKEPPIHRTVSVHTSISNIERVDQHAEGLRRSRNSLLNEAIEMLLEAYDKASLQGRWKNIATAAIDNGKKKAGTR